MSVDLTLFSIHDAATVTLSADSPSASVALPRSFTQTGGATIMVVNPGTVTVYLNSGNSSVTATATAGVPIPGGEKGTYRIDPKDTHIAGFSSTPQDVYISQGSGA